MVGYSVFMRRGDFQVYEFVLRVGDSGLGLRGSRFLRDFGF